MLKLLSREPDKNDYAKIRLSNGKFAKVDKESYNWLNAYYWRAKLSHSCYYAARRKITNGKATTILMHREITQCPKNMVVHHRNHDTLDNRSENLVNVYQNKHYEIHNSIA